MSISLPPAHHRESPEQGIDIVLSFSMRFVFFAFLFIALNAHAAPECANLFNPNPFKKFKSELKTPPQITMSRFNGFDSFHEIYSSKYHLTNEKFSLASDPLHSKQVGFSRNETFMNQLQKFPLGKMVETGYITSEDMPMFESFGTSFERAQITFYTVHREANQDALRKYPEELRKIRIAGYEQNGTIPISTASLYSVAGQVLDQGRSQMRTVPLAWELEDARKGQELDRKRYKFVWEIGRGAQDIAEEIKPLFAASVANMYIDLIAQGGHLDDAYVTFHSFDKVNTRLYLSDHPNGAYPPDWPNKDDMLFLVPLAERIQKYPPSLFSNHVAKITKISEGKISELQALDILFQLRLLRWEELDLTGRVRQNGPIILNDVSKGKILELLVILRQFDLGNERTSLLMDYLVDIRPTLFTLNANDKYANAADSLVTSFHYQQHNAVEISNLDPTLAARDPNYVRLIVFESYLYYLNKMARVLQKTYQLSKIEARKEAFHLIEKHQIKFGVTNSSAEIQKQCEKLNPEITSFQQGTIMERPDAEFIKSHPNLVKDNHISIFTISQISAWAREHGSLFTNTNYEMNPGFWRAQYFSSQVDIL